MFEEIKRLTTNSRWNLFISMLKPMRCSHICIQSIKINSLKKHHLNYKSDRSMQTSHILCF
jgi:hypothetical protein